MYAPGEQQRPVSARVVQLADLPLSTDSVWIGAAGSTRAHLQAPRRACTGAMRMLLRLLHPLGTAAGTAASTVGLADLMINGRVSAGLGHTSLRFQQQRSWCSLGFSLLRLHQFMSDRFLRVCDLQPSSSVHACCCCWCSGGPCR